MSRMASEKSTKHKNGLFIFHRDLRVTDNTGLIQASATCEKLYTCFIFTPDQVGNGNSFRSQNAIQFISPTHIAK